MLAQSLGQGSVQTDDIFQRLFEAAPDPQILFDTERRIVLANAECETLLGYTPQELMSVSLDALLPKRFRMAHRRQTTQFFSHPGSGRMGSGRELWALHKNGTEIPVEIALNTIIGDDGTFVLAVLRDASVRRQLEFTTRLLAAAVDSASEAIVVSAHDGTVLAWNAGAEQLYGYTAEAALGRHVSMLPATARDRERQARAIELARLGETVSISGRRRRPDGRVVQIDGSLTPVIDPSGETVAFASITRDVTESRRLADELGLRSRMLDWLDIGVLAADPAGRIIFWNDGARRMYGWTMDEVVGRHLVDLQLSEDAAGREARMAKQLSETGYGEETTTALRKDGTSFPALTRRTVVRGQRGAVRAVVSVSIDISDRVASERAVAESRDYLNAMTQHLGAGLLAIDERGAVVYANASMERFAGREAGPLLGASVVELIEAPGLERTTLLESLQPHDGAAHLEGAELHRADGRTLPVAVTATPLPGTSEPQWAVVLVDDSEQRAALARLERELERFGWVGNIEAALRDGSFVLHAQPIISLHTGQTSHDELLIRMRAADGSIIPPGAFLPAAEEHGLITRIDRWVVEQGIQIAAGGRRVAINLSAASLADRSTPDWISTAIADSGVDPGVLVFEVTETALLRDLDAGQHLVSTLAHLGCRVALDDFGVGYGSLTYLKQFDIALVKIDMQFVQDILTSEASQNVVRGILSLAQAFQLETIAEGIEDQPTADLLKELGVDYAQGYLFGRPGPLKRPRRRR